MDNRPSGRYQISPQEPTATQQPNSFVAAAERASAVSVGSAAKATVGSEISLTRDTHINGKIMKYIYEQHIMEYVYQQLIMEYFYQQHIMEYFYQQLIIEYI